MLNRKVHRAYNRTREGNFSLVGLTGSCLHGKTLGVIGTGRIGMCMINIAQGFGMKVVAHDVFENARVKEMGIPYVPVLELAKESDVVSLHCPLTTDNTHIISEEFCRNAKAGSLILNTSRGALVDADAVLESINEGHVGGLGMDVYEHEDEVFFDDHSNGVIHDPTLLRLLGCNRVVLTGHQGFLTDNALEQISDITISNISKCLTGESVNGNEVVDGMQ
eukprot:Filipodium_phascolosomae@DN1835_c0_g1_i2.p1